MVPVGGSPYAATVDTHNGAVYVSNIGTDSVDVINGSTNALMASIPMGGTGPGEIAYDAGNGQVYLSNGEVDAIDTADNTIAATINTAYNPNSLAVDAGNGDVYVACTHSDIVSVIDGADDHVIANISVGADPGAYSGAVDVVVDPVNGDVYVANTGSANVSVIDGSTNTELRSIPVGGGPDALAVNPTNGDVYVANSGSDNLSVIDGSTNEVVASVPVGSNPSSVAYDPINGQIFVANSGTGNVSVIQSSDNKVVATTPVGSEPSFTAFDPANQALYVTNYGSGSMTVLSGSNDSVVTTVPVGSSPFAVAIDPTNGDVYVGNVGSGTVSVLPGEPIWSTSISFIVPAGAHYLFHVTKPSRYRGAPIRGHVRIPMHTDTKLLKFRLNTDVVIFRESGLTPHQRWQVNLTGPEDAMQSSTSHSIRFELVNGSYSYEVGTVAGFSDTPSSGSFVVSVPHHALVYRISFTSVPTVAIGGNLGVGVQSSTMPSFGAEVASSGLAARQSQNRAAAI